MRARFIGGSMDGKYSEVFESGGQPYSTWNVPLPPPAPRLIPSDLDSILDIPWSPSRETYQHDGWYVRFSTGTHTPIYLFKGAG